MILYNVTISIDETRTKVAQLDEENYIPDVLKTNCFIDCTISRIKAEEEGGKTYAIMYTCESKEKMDFYQRHPPLLFKMITISFCR